VGVAEVDGGVDVGVEAIDVAEFGGWEGGHGRLLVSVMARVAVSGDGERDRGVAACGGDEGDVQRHRAAAGDEQGAKDGDAERSDGLAEALKTPKAGPT